MRFILLFISTSLSFCCCVSKPPSSSTKIRTIGIVDTLPWLSNTAAIEEDNVIFYSPEETKLISFYKQYRLYRIPIHNTLDSIYFTDSSMRRVTYSRDTTYWYYLRQDTAAVVYKLDSLSDPTFKKEPIDSLYHWSSVYKEPSFWENEIAGYIRKGAVEKNKDITTESFIRNTDRKGKLEGLVDTMYLSYSANEFWKNIPYSISFTADAAKKGKLVKVRLVWNALPEAEETFRKKAKIYSSEIREEKPKNEKEILQTFLRFEHYLNH